MTRDAPAHRWWDVLIVAVAIGVFIWLGRLAKVPAMQMNTGWMFAQVLAMFVFLSPAVGFSGSEHDFLEDMGMLVAGAVGESVPDRGGTMFLRLTIALLFLAVMPSATQTPFAKIPKPVLRVVVDVPLPGSPVRFDYQSLDPINGRLYISHMNADQLVVFDTLSRKVIANLDGFARVHGVWAVPELSRVYASVTGGHRVDVVDEKTLQVVAHVGPIFYPDGLTYAPGTNRVFVSDEHGKSDAVIDTQSNRLLTTIPLGGEAGNTVYDSGAKRIMVAVHETNELVAIDPATMCIVERHRLVGVAKPHGVSIDVADRLGFVAGEGNQMLGIVDLVSMKVLATYHVGNDPDVLAFDAGLGLLYVASESGSVSVFRLRGRDLTLEGELSMPHAHTVAVDQKTHLVYFPLENIDGRPLLRIMELGRMP